MIYIILIGFFVVSWIKINYLKKLERAKIRLQYAYDSGIWKKEAILTARLLEEKEFVNVLAEGTVDQMNNYNGWANIENSYLRRFETKIEKP